MVGTLSIRYRAVTGMALASVVALGLAACSAGSSSGGASGGKTDVRIALGSAPSSLNPLLLQTSDDVILDSALYDTLVRIDEGGKVVANLAASWKVTATSIDFTLRSGTTCSDGTPLTAADVAASINYMADPKSGASGGSATFGNGTGHATGKGNHVMVTDSKPWGSMLDSLAAAWSAIVCPAGLKNPKALASTPAGTGPYTLVSAHPGVSYTLRRRDGYRWGASYAKLGKGALPKTLTYTVVSDQNTRLNLLRSGGVDVAGVPDTYVKQAPQAMANVPYIFGVFMFWFNESRGNVTASQDVRKAIIQAIDRNAFLQDATAGRGKLVDSWGLPQMPCYDSSLTSSIPAYDQAAARAAKVRGPIRILSDNFLGTNGSEYVLAALKAAGINARLTNLDEAAFDHNLLSAGGGWDIAMTPLGASIENSLTADGRLFTGPPPPDGLNIGHVNNPQYDAAYASASTQIGQGACSAWTDAQRALVGRHDFLPLSTIGGAYFFQSGVSGLAPAGTLDPATLRTS
jgi:peptide/nickel transport system substrate-binding protein